jgi:A/G-specific adenine glycosylase
MNCHGSGDDRSGRPDAPNGGSADTPPTARRHDRGTIDRMPSTTLAERAIRWYDATARDLPWRRPGTTAWAVLVSEVMLQQTPVARVEPVWREWMARWPGPADLAAEPAGEAIRAWGRLGYPRRALRLHGCAQALVERHHGQVPADLALLLDLPGVGSYTARAVAAFAYGQRQPVVDTNVRRLVARAKLGRPDGGSATTSADLLVVQELLPGPPARAARASIAFMELGALVCTARAPSCADCPLGTVCAWRAAGAPADPDAVRRRAPGFAGTDRQVRGLILALVRTGPADRTAIDALWPDPVQLERALAGLITDGLLTTVDGARYHLPGLA